MRERHTMMLCPVLLMSMLLMLPQLMMIAGGQIQSLEGSQNKILCSLLPNTHKRLCVAMEPDDDLHTARLHILGMDGVGIEDVDDDDDDDDDDLHARRKRETFRFTKEKPYESFLDLQPRNQAPNISCSSIPDVVYTEIRETAITVSWKPATAYDEEEGILSVIQTEGHSSGTVHAEGNHVVTYMSRDRDGLAAFCSIYFTVAVHRCNHSHTYLDHGTAQCSPAIHPNIYGSTCSYTCETGYQLVGPSQIQCDDQGRWTGDKPVCEAVRCGPPANVSNGYLVCVYPLYTYPSTCQLICQPGYTTSGEDNSISCQNSGQWTTAQPCSEASCTELDPPQNSELSCSIGNTYNSVCTVTCHQDYVIEGESSRRCQANQTWSGEQPVCKATCSAPPFVSHGKYQCLNGHQYQESCSLICDSGYTPVAPLTITCNVDKQWSQSGSCKDTESPQFPNGCPKDMDVIAPSLGIRKTITYAFPKVKDNSEERVTMVGNPPSGSEFDLGSTTVTVTASDSTGNQASCQFVINQRGLYCRDPNALVSENDPIVYTCPDGFIDGATCDVSCSDGSSVTGSTSVRCGAIYIFDARQWRWSGNVAPYCQNSCSPGQQSNTGNQPCELCSRGTYQSKYGQTSCDLCPYSMSTLISGATSKNDCHFFDLKISPYTPLPDIQLNDAYPRSFSFSLWLKLEPENPRMALHLVLDPAQASAGSVYLSLDGVAIFIFPADDTTSAYIRYWYHVALVFDNGGERVGSITLYINGEEIDTVDNLLPAELNKKSLKLDYYGESYLLFKDNDLTISAFQMIPRALNRSEIHELTTMCKTVLDSNVLAANQPISTITITPTECDTVNDCIDQPCSNHGTCLDDSDEFTCMCDPGWTGKLCEIPPDYCTNSPCANDATCISHHENSSYTCVCTKGYKGPRCDQVVVNGNWSEWTPWSSCSVACGEGQRSRVRTCDNPSPDPTGQDCVGDREERQVCSGINCPVDGGYGEWTEWSQCSVSCGGGVFSRRRTCDNPTPSNGGKPCDAAQAVSSVQCNAVKCPECMTLTKRKHHNGLECSLSQDKSMQECHVTCPPGFSLVPDQTDNSFLCGRLTNYTWTHQTDRNPTALLPDCADQRLPTQTSVVLNYEYNNLTCNQPQLLTNLSMAIQTRFQQVSGCQQSDSCNQSVVVQTNCDTKTLDNRGENILSASVNLTFFNKNQTLLAPLSSMSEEDRARAQTYVDALEAMLTQLTSDSSELLQVSVNSGQYWGQFVSAQMMVNCPHNQAYYNGFCVDCPAGSYSAGNGSCLLCEPGFYQNQTGMSSCLSCPQCLSTLGTGSYSVQHCSVDICTVSTLNTVDESKEDSSESLPWPLLVGVAGGVAVCVTIVFVVIWLVRRHRKKAARTTHPYDIPHGREHKDDDPYATAGDDPYDQIDEDPYASAEGFVQDQVSDGYIKAKHVNYSLDSRLGVEDSGVSNGSYDVIDGELRQPVGKSGNAQTGVTTKRELPPPGMFDDHVEIELRNTSSSQDRIGKVPSYLQLLNTSDHKKGLADESIESVLGAKTDEETQLGIESPDRSSQADAADKSDNAGEQENHNVPEAEEELAPNMCRPDLAGAFSSEQNMNDELCHEVLDKPAKEKPPIPHKPARVYGRQGDGKAIGDNDGYLTPY